MPRREGLLARTRRYCIRHVRRATNMTEPRRKILVTSALPYANGPIHIGHLVEYIQTDIWVRFQRSRGHDCIYVCADDAHGTPVMLKAEQDRVTPEALIDSMGREHRADFAEFSVAFDNYYTTHSEENREFTEYIYRALRDQGAIAVRTIRQAYDPVREMFLPDRYIRGTCPRCGAAEQYGDSCEVCGSTYSPTELEDAVSVVSGETPVERDSEHYFVVLSTFDQELRDWVHGAAGTPAAVQTEIANKLDEWFSAGLADWDVSRDPPYFGFEIPDAPGKYFYVWVDAPIGYMASFKNLCAQRADLDFDEYWNQGSQVELHQFVGKDVAYFHTLFWPAMLLGAGFRAPTAVHCHGFLTVDGQKMSKRRGTFIKARTYLDHLNPEHLRYYFGCKLGGGIDDLDLNLEDFARRVNSDLVGKVVNIASRCAGFVNKGFEGRLAEQLAEPDLYAEFEQAGDGIAAAFEAREYGRAVRSIMALADRANRYIDDEKPWVAVKSRENRPQVQAVCSMGINLFRVLSVYLAPLIPTTSAKAEKFLNASVSHWDDVKRPLLGTRLEPFESLMHRVEAKDVDAMVEASRESAPESSSELADQAPEVWRLDPLEPEIDLDQFAKLDLRVARVAAAEEVEGADRLLRLTLDLDGVQRTVFAGIKHAYRPEQLVGRLTVVVANLAPRAMRFGVSEGMVLAAGPGDEHIWLVGVDAGATPGTRVR